MAYTQYRRLSVQAGASNSGTWGAGGTTGDDLNTGVMSLLDYMLAGLTTFSVSGATVALDYTIGGGGAVTNALWRFTGSLLQNAVVSPNAGNATTYLTGTYFWENLTTGSFTVTLTTGTGSVVLPQGRRGSVFLDATNAPRITSIAGAATADPIPGNGTTKMLFAMASPPAGWTQVTTYNNYALRLVNSTGAGTGGSTGFTSVFTSRTPAGTNASTTGAATLSSGNVYPAAVVGAANANRLIVGVGVSIGGSGILASDVALSVTAAGSAFTGTPMDFAVQYLDMLLASRD